MIYGSKSTMLDSFRALFAVILLACTVHADAVTVTLSSPTLVVSDSFHETTILLSTELGIVSTVYDVYNCAQGTSSCSPFRSTFVSTEYTESYTRITTITERVSSVSWNPLTTIITSVATSSANTVKSAAATITEASSSITSSPAVETNTTSLSPSAFPQAESTDLSSGVKAGIAVSVILGVGLGIAVPLFIMRHRRNKRQQNETDAHGGNLVGSANASAMSATREKDLADHMASSSEVREDVGVYKAFHPSYAGPQISELPTQTRQSVYEMDAANHMDTIR